MAHLAIVSAAREAHNLDRIDLCLSLNALGKDEVLVPSFEDRLAVLQAEAANCEWLEVVVTQAQLIADIAHGYDVVIMGVDKWTQINQSVWYGSDAQRDRALATLPTVVVAPRTGFEWSETEHGRAPLETPESTRDMSSSGARDGAVAWMTPMAQQFDAATGAWTDPDRYRNRFAR